MNTILTIYEQDIIPEATVIETADFHKREAARAVVFDSTHRVALLHVGLYGYHKLPGGGVDRDESISSALERELLEEIGCKVKVTGEVGKIIEYRNQSELMQISYCFMALQVGKKSEPDFTEKERREQFSVFWADSIDDAIRLLGQDKPTNYEGKFIQKRDIALLKAAKEKYC